MVQIDQGTQQNDLATMMQPIGSFLLLLSFADYDWVLSQLILEMNYCLLVFVLMEAIHLKRFEINQLTVPLIIHVQLIFPLENQTKIKFEESFNQGDKATDTNI